MLWILVLLIAAIAFATSAGFRKLIGCVAVLVALLALWLWADNQHQQSLATAGKSLVSLRQLEITDVRLANPYGSYGVTGRIKNNSPHTVTGVSMHVQFRDCNPDCVVVGEQVVDVAALIPPDQARDIDASLYLSHINFKGTFHWNYDITEIRAK